jgi:hypothetical protein
VKEAGAGTVIGGHTAVIIPEGAFAVSLYVVYGLHHKDDPSVVYIGSTKRGARWRLVKHVETALHESPRRLIQWMRAVGRENVRIRVLCAVCEGDEKALREAERWWIRSARVDNWPLLNSEHIRGPEYRAKLSEASARVMSDPEHRERIAEGVRRHWSRVRGDAL